MDTPSGKVAAKIVGRLVKEKLLRAADQSKVLPKLAEGTLNSQDWRLAVELAETKVKKHE